MKNLFFILFVCISGALSGQISCPPPDAPSPVCLTIDVSNINLNQGGLFVNVLKDGVQVWSSGLILTETNRSYLVPISANSSYTVRYGGSGQTYFGNFTFSGAHTFNDSIDSSTSEGFKETFFSSGDCSCNGSASTN